MYMLKYHSNYYIFFNEKDIFKHPIKQYPIISNMKFIDHFSLEWIAKQQLLCTVQEKGGRIQMIEYIQRFPLSWHFVCQVAVIDILPVCNTKWNSFATKYP